MKPDISFLEGERVVAIADVKWKLLDASEAKLGISQADLYQMQAYASRYGVDTLMLIYPRQQGLEYSYRLTLQGLKQVQLEVITMGVEKDRNTHIAKSLQPVFAVS